jgi:hypothetical protein
MSETSLSQHSRDDDPARCSPQLSVELRALRQTLHDATGHYLEAQRQYWLARHTVHAHRHYQVATARLKMALEALLIYLEDDPGFEAEYRRLAHALVEVYVEQVRVQERVWLERIRAIT